MKTRAKTSQCCEAPVPRHEPSTRAHRLLVRDARSLLSDLGLGDYDGLPPCASLDLAQGCPDPAALYGSAHWGAPAHIRAREAVGATESDHLAVISRVDIPHCSSLLPRRDVLSLFG